MAGKVGPRRPGRAKGDNVQLLITTSIAVGVLSVGGVIGWSVWTLSPTAPAAAALPPAANPPPAPKPRNAPVGVNRPAAPSRSSDADAAQPDPAETLLTAAATAANQHDWASLVATRCELETLIQSDTQSPTLEALRADRRVVEQAQGLIRAMRYDEAVRLLGNAWSARLAEPHPQANDGSIGVALLEACVAPMAIDGHWLVPELTLPAGVNGAGHPSTRPTTDDATAQRQALQTLAQDLRARCPLAIEAVLFDAWLTTARGSDELMRQDLRQQVIERNRLLLPLRDALSDPRVWSQSVSVEQAVAVDPQQAQNPVGLIRAQATLSSGAKNEAARRLLRSWIAQIDYLLGDSRGPALLDYTDWAELLNPDRIIHLLGSGGREYMLTGDLLWEHSGADAGGSWSLLLPVRDPTARAPRWQRYQASICAWGPWIRAANDSPLARTLNLLQATGGSGSGYQSFATDIVGPEMLYQANVPVLQLATDQFLRAPQSNGTVRLDPNLLSDALLVEPPMSFDAAEPGEGRAPSFNWQIAVPDPSATPQQHQVSALVTLTKLGDPTPIHAFDTSDGSTLPALFGVADGRSYVLAPDGGLRTLTPGGSVAIRPTVGASLASSQLGNTAFRRLATQLIGSSPWFKLLSDGREWFGSPTDDQLISLILDGGDLRFTYRHGSVPFTPPQKLQRGFETSMRRVVTNLRRLVTTLAFGIDNRRRFLSIDRQASQAMPELRLRDTDGNPVDVFYSVEQYTSLQRSYVNDFIARSRRAVYWPMLGDAVIAERASVGSRPNDRAVFNRFVPPPSPGGQKYELDLCSDFTLARWRPLMADGDLHRAAVLLREAGGRQFELAAFDGSQPLDDAGSRQLLSDFSQIISVAEKELARRDALQQVLKTGQRVDAASLVDRSTQVEYAAAVLPLYRSLVRYANSYGYTSPPDARQTGATLEGRFGDPAPMLAHLPLMLPATTSDAKTFNDQKAAQLLSQETSDGNAEPLNTFLDAFYASRPSLNEYLKAKRWLLANASTRLFRRPDSTFEVHLLAWRPLLVPDGATGSGGNGNASPNVVEASFEDVFADGANVSPGLVRYRSALYLMEVHRDPVGARDQLLALALESLATANRASSPLDPVGIVADVNRVGAIYLATHVNGLLPFDLQIARIDPRLVHACSLELSNFIERRMVGAGVPDAAARAMLRSTELTEPDDRSADLRPWLAQRHYWSEWDQLTTMFVNYLNTQPPNGSDLSFVGQALIAEPRDAREVVLQAIDARRNWYGQGDPKIAAPADLPPAAPSRPMPRPAASPRR